MSKLVLGTLIKNSLLPEKEKQKWLKLMSKLKVDDLAELTEIFKIEQQQRMEVEKTVKNRLNQINQKYFELLKKLKREKVRGAYRRTEAEEREAEEKREEGMLEEMGKSQ